MLTFAPTHVVPFHHITSTKKRFILETSFEHFITKVQLKAIELFKINQ